MFLFLLACTSNKTQDTAELVETTEFFTPTMPISECGLEEYEWLSTETMGDIVSTSRRDDLSLSLDTIQILLENYELPLPDPSHSVETYYIQYKSQDKGQEVLGTGMIAFPQEIENAPVILWTHPTMGFSDECAPTASGLIGAAYPVLFASLGFIVVAPDYLGMSGWIGESEEVHPYVVAEATAILSIDSLRSLPKLIEKQNIPIAFDSQKISIWGASEGGYAALFTDRYLPHYAPEFQSIATIAAIPATDPFTLAQHAVNVMGPTSAGIMAVQVSMHQWYDSSHSLGEFLQPIFADNIIESMLSNCSDFPIFEEVDEITDVFTQEYIDGINNDDGSQEHWACPLKENALSRSKIPLERVAPTYIVTAENDDLAIAEPIHHDINTLCEQGYEITHQQCAGAGHVDGALESLDEQFTWLQARLDGEPLGTTCQVQDPAPCE